MTTISFDVQPGSRIDRFQKKIAELTAADQAARQPLAELESAMGQRMEAINAQILACRWPADIAEHAALLSEQVLLEREQQRVRASIPRRDGGLQRLIQQANLAIDAANSAWARLQVLEDDKHPEMRQTPPAQRDAERENVRKVAFGLLDPAGMSEAPCGVARDDNGVDIFI